MRTGKEPREEADRVETRGADDVSDKDDLRLRFGELTRLPCCAFSRAADRGPPQGSRAENGARRCSSDRKGLL